MKHHYRVINLLGHRYGRLSIIRQAKNVGRKSTWLCKCDCGNEIVVLSNSLRSGNTKSCGCLKIEGATKRCKARTLPTGEASFNALYSRVKSRAKARNLKWNLTKEQFGYFTKQNCHYCGIEPKQTYTARNANGAYIYNGLDRANNNDRGYHIDNVVSCGKNCNYMKKSLSVEEFISHIKTIIKHLEEQE